MLALDLSSVLEPLTAALENLTWIDWTCVGILGLGFAVGICKGLVWQVGRLAALATALVLAVRWGPGFGVWLAGPIDGAEAPLGYVLLGRGLVFVVTLIVMWMLGSAAARRVQAGPLKTVDRVSGGLAGAGIGGVVMVAALAAVMLYVPGAGHSDGVQNSYAVRASRHAVGALGSWAPEGMRRIYGLPVADPETREFSSR